MKSAAKRAEALVHDHSSDSSSDEEYGDQAKVPKGDRVGTQAGLGFEEESIETARLRAQVQFHLWLLCPRALLSLSATLMPSTIVGYV